MDLSAFVEAGRGIALFGAAVFLAGIVIPEKAFKRSNLDSTSFAIAGLFGVFVGAVLISVFIR